MGSPLTGHLLIANASLFDPNFRRSVVLIGHHDDEGAVGVVLDRPLDAPAHAAVPALADLVDDAEPLFEGGPVEPGSVVVLADFLDPSLAEIIVIGTVGFLPPESDRDLRPAIRRARIYSGYSGWGPGQLEAELAEEAWVVEPALPQDAFYDDPSRLWGDVLRRKGHAFDLLRSMPADPSQN
jgi:putative transcriptional regulator